jgi:hypothetical protein
VAFSRILNCKVYSYGALTHNEETTTIHIKNPNNSQQQQTISVSLYGCGTWSLTLKEECRLTVFENKMPRKIFGPKQDEVTG